MFIGLLDGGGRTRLTAFKRSLALLSAAAMVLVGVGAVASAEDPPAAPKAVVSPSGVVKEASGGSVTLDASGSSSANDPLSYAWLKDGTKVPDSTEATYTLTGSDTVVSVQVEVTDASGATALSAPVAVVFGEIAEQQPVIEGLPDPGNPVAVGETLALNLKDSKGLYPSTAYRWYVDGALAKQGNISDEDGGDFSLETRDVGRHSVLLALTSPLSQRASVSGQFTVAEADANADIEADMDLGKVPMGSTVTFDGSKSTGFGYKWFYWTRTGESGYVSRDTTYAGKFEKPGTYAVALKILDGAGNWAKADVRVTVVGSSPPDAIFTPDSDQEVSVGTSITFDSSASKDADGPIKRTWTSTGVRGVASTETVYERKFDKGGRYTVKLSVKDSEYNETTKSITVTVTDKPPVARFTPGADQTVPVGTLIKFDGKSSSDPERGQLKYEWWTTGIQGVVSKVDSYSRRFTAPGKFRVRMFVTDFSGNRTEKVVEITVKGEAPVVSMRPGQDRTVTAGTEITFNGSGSYDPNGGDVRYWWWTTGVPGVVSDKATYTRTFRTPGKFRVKLAVSNSVGKSATKIIEITVI